MHRKGCYSPPAYHGFREQRQQQALKMGALRNIGPTENIGKCRLHRLLGPFLTKMNYPWTLRTFRQLSCRRDTSRIIRVPLGLEQLQEMLVQQVGIVIRTPGLWSSVPVEHCLSGSCSSLRCTPLRSMR